MTACCLLKGLGLFARSGGRDVGTGVCRGRKRGSKPGLKEPRLKRLTEAFRLGKWLGWAFHLFC